MESFNPNMIGVPNGNYFALPYSIEESELVLISVPWDSTVSYGAGTHKGPKAILDASVQIDLFDERIPKAWEVKIGTAEFPKRVEALNSKTRKKVEAIILKLEQGVPEEALSNEAAAVNEASAEVNSYVYNESRKLLSQGKIVGVVGGEHSVPLGLIKALGEVHDEFGVLHLDAHADLRESYEGFEFSHASIMYNSLRHVPQISRLTQVGIRDYCLDERDIIEQDSRIIAFTDIALKRGLFEGENWGSICEKIIATLPDKVYISFDIDSLAPDNCPGTGTPVPGGLSFSEAEYLLYSLIRAGKRIIGFDLCEVAPSAESEWDANVGARILYRLALFASNNRD